MSLHKIIRQTYLPADLPTYRPTYLPTYLPIVTTYTSTYLAARYNLLDCGRHSHVIPLNPSVRLPIYGPQIDVTLAEWVVFPKHNILRMNFVRKHKTFTFGIVRGPCHSLHITHATPFLQKNHGYTRALDNHTPSAYHALHCVQPPHV
jgi:hypothetical protein